MNKKLCAALAATVFAPAAFADTAAVALDPVIITATRTPVPESQVLAAVTVITREEIQRAQANDLAQLLATRAGLDIGRNGGPGQPASVFIRGGNSDQTLVLIDGVRVNPSSFGGAALALIAPEMIERIEIVKGPRSTLYGSDALAGVINIITRAPDATRLDAQARAGSYGTTELSVSHAFGDEHAGLAITADRTRSDGLPAFRGDTQDRGYNLTTVALRGEAKLGVAKLKAQAWRAEGNNQYSSLDLGFGGPPDFATTLKGFIPRDHDTVNQTAALALEVSPLSNWDTRLQFSHSTDRIIENQGGASVRSLRPELRLDNTVRLGAQRLSFGANLAQDRVDVEGGDAVHDVRKLGAVYAQGEFVYGRNHAVAAASYNHYDGFDSQPTFNLEYGLDAWTGARLLASFGTGFRAPNANQRFTAFGGNPALKPERSRSYEAGMQQNFGANHHLDLRVFRNSVRDLIAFKFDFSLPDFGDNLNLNHARTQGVELGYRGQFGPLEARVEGVVQSAKDCSTDAQGNAIDSCSDGARLKRRNNRSISGALTYKLTRGYVGIDAYAAGNRRDFEGQPPFASDVKDAGYGLFNASAGLSLGHGVSLALRGENLLDQDYQTANGYRQPGASGYASLRYSFTR